MAKPLPIFRRSLGDSWRSLLGWTIGAVAALSLYLPLWPSVGGGGQMEQMLESMPPELINTLGFEELTSGAGYAKGTFFGLIGFLLFVIAATFWGSAAIAGAEESGRLELALAHGVSRVQYAVESALSILVRLVWLGGIAVVMVLVLNGPSELDIEPAHAVAAGAALVGLAFLSGMLALAVGALTGRRVLGTIAGAGVAVLGYVLNAIANQLEDGELLHAVSPYAWAYSEAPLTNGADWGGLALLWGTSVLLAALAAISLNRRNITG